MNTAVRPSGGVTELGVTEYPNLPCQSRVILGRSVTPVLCHSVTFTSTAQSTLATRAANALHGICLPNMSRYLPILCLALIHALVDGVAMFVEPLWPRLTTALDLSERELFYLFAIIAVAPNFSQVLFG